MCVPISIWLYLELVNHHFVLSVNSYPMSVDIDRLFRYLKGVVCWNGAREQFQWVNTSSAPTAPTSVIDLMI